MIALNEGMKEALELNAKLQQKKQTVRAALAASGPVQKDKKNEHSKYTYLSEAKYKELFTQLLAEHGLELTSSCEEEKEIQTNHKSFGCGRVVTWQFTLTDTDTGYYEESHVTAEGWDSGDKAIYKAHTGALKYYLANTFMVASGDDAERDTQQPDQGYRANGKALWATKEQVQMLQKLFDGRTIQQILNDFRIQSLEQLSFEAASEIIQGAGGPRA